MLYQNILGERSPYLASVAVLGSFGEHRHGDVEINYCLEGSFSVIIDKKSYTVNAGQFSLITPMASHEYNNDRSVKRRVFTMIVGISFLKKYFAKFSEISVESPVFTLSDDIPEQKKLTELFCETAELCTSKENRRELLIQGNLYKICDYLIELSYTSSNRLREPIGICA